MPQGSFMLDHDFFEVVLQSKAKKKRFDDSHYDESPSKKSKDKKKDFSEQRKNKRGELL